MRNRGTVHRPYRKRGGGVTEGETEGGREKGGGASSGIRLLQGREMSCEVKVEM